MIEENKAIIARDVKVFLDEPPDEAQKRRNEYCRKCFYKAGSADKDKNGRDQPYTKGCGYILKTGSIRPCAPSECVAQGIFRKEKGDDR